MSKNTTTVSQILTLTTAQGQELVLAEGADVDTILAPSMRAEPQYGADASHVTNTTRKYQANMYLGYEAAVAKIKKQLGASRDGAAIRAIFEAGLAALGFEALVEEAHSTEDDSAE